MEYRNPIPTVDILIEDGPGRVLLIQRRNAPLGWAIPGGFVDEGETVESAALREAKEETCLDVELLEQFAVYSDPRRDPRKHTMSVVFIARAPNDEPVAADDAVSVKFVTEASLPEDLVFDHSHILRDYFHYRRCGERPRFGAGYRGLHGPET